MAPVHETGPYWPQADQAAGPWSADRVKPVAVCGTQTSRAAGKGHLPLRTTREFARQAGAVHAASPRRQLHRALTRVFAS